MPAPAPSSPLITATELRDRLGGASAPVLLDVRWALGDPHGYDHYLKAHIPGAVFADLDRELAAPPEPLAGRHPLPDVAELQAAARRWGIRDGGAVVVYDDSAGTAAARAWWLLRWAGIEDVTLLDGGLAAWRAAGFDAETGLVEAAPGDVTLRQGALPTIDADEAAALARDGVLLDARLPERYRGDVEPVDPRAGHVPGARSASTFDNVDADGRFLAPELLRARFEALGATDDTAIGVYCGSGVTAAHEIAALAVAGFEAALYPGSWSAWSSDERRPAATGEDPG